MRFILKLTALGIPSVFLALLLGRLAAIEIYAAKFPDSPTVKALRINPLMSLKINKSEDKWHDGIMARSRA